MKFVCGCCYCFIFYSLLIHACDDMVTSTQSHERCVNYVAMNGWFHPLDLMSSVEGTFSHFCPRLIVWRRFLYSFVRNFWYILMAHFHSRSSTTPPTKGQYFQRVVTWNIFAILKISRIPKVTANYFFWNIK